MSSRYSRKAHVGVLVLAAAAVLFVSGCASERGGGKLAPLPGAISARWTPPANATRTIAGELAAVREAAVATANALGFSVRKFDGSGGRISASRRQDGSFGEARETTLEITVTDFAPGSVQVAVVLRELTESGGSVSAGLIRDPATYDVFFARLEETLRAAAPAVSAPAISAAPTPVAP